MAAAMRSDELGLSPDRPTRRIRGMRIGRTVLLLVIGVAIIAWVATPPATPLAMPTDSTSTPRPLQRSVRAKVTAYCACARCCGQQADGLTATGRDARGTRGVAVDGVLVAIGARVTIPGAGTFTADDSGGAMRRAARDGRTHIDLRFGTHDAALDWGVRTLDVTIADARP